MANSTGNPPESYPAEHFIGKPGCQCEPCRAWFEGWNAGYEAGKKDSGRVVHRKDGLASLLRSIVSESHAAGDRKTLGEALDALCALAGYQNALATAGARKFLVRDGRCVMCGAKIGLNEQDHLSTCDKCIRSTVDGEQHFITPEHDADIAYYEREVRTARSGSLNPSEWPELEAEIVRVQEVRRVVNALAANPDFRIPPSPAQLAMYDTSDEAGE